MRVLTKSFNLQSASHFLGFSMLIMIVLIQSVAHASATPMPQEHAIYQDMTSISPDCPYGDMLSADDMDPLSERADKSANTLHCMQAICCFHGAMSAPELELLGKQILITLRPELRVALSSHSEIRKDRPPQIL